jgi:BirA family biotin operon repressor/biotin-[acetyl-CoA-carboxylase] ligase
MVNLTDSYRIIELTKTDSTNEEAKRLIKDGSAINGMVIIAAEQDSGHGRYGRVWESPKGNLYTSIILKLDESLQKIPQISFVTALAVGKVLEDILPEEFAVQYKWPNDVLVNKKKISGILLESLNSWLIIGVGINVDNCPQGLQNPVISMNECGSKGLLPRDLLIKLVSFFVEILNLWQNAGFKPIRATWLSQAYKLNEEIDVNLSDKKMAGVFNGISAEGELELLLAGEKKFISSGEVFF